ncbi:protein-export membrane protein SecF [Candidatus Falkowbacteria bacterium RIFOXYB2_FULL_34_18]|uniref:Protein-export membrane protein SecF n=1 Tax=Candidatus Falkowbacteria bacterium RIFOXYD2_FULL_34_120 TaxID=1798007 RepID=A0A1F5TMU6_9BACT|nr:MAG: protein-export membrane protein SecF [Candidatus Falkowbacteria bacterium RIFOXYB2_FULL_34_18]OGF28339.1 MAG: protein-export membrane protein SecF [Candidatus Falkowbacteria bacterium RIFOXYC12_FULL_34_55]OGF37942.1 MAG: protein-export membrane protein SecF [Candidatus Falkowbacteria bacterium RIFOXYC2_FULL_34_220]OGF39660.1 MAG: protein-export membrane protein SecF [Candidatus Falkowbacteria bacterium RIFOXYD12_FULL_34_57]OGF40099.1 MAG: protein-export membrane protein SecF [Candidatus
MYQIIQKRGIWITISTILVALSIIALFIWGLKFGIDFTGGSLLEVRFKNERPAINDVQKAVEDLDLGSLITQNVGDQGTILRFQNISEDKHQEVLKRLRGLVDRGLVDTEGEADQKAFLNTKEIDASNVEELRYDAVGPTIGQELRRKSITAIVIVLIVIVLYIAWAFRKVSRPVASWKYGISAIIALFHDVIIVVGAFAVLGRFYGIEVNAPFVAAILTVLGYSVNDTIVVFDRVRENLPKSDDNFEETINTSVNDTITRSINTSFTTILVLLAIFFFGGDSIKDFVLALSIGIFIGTYSSIFLASPILVIWEKVTRNNA